MYTTLLDDTRAFLSAYTDSKIYLDTIVTENKGIDPDVYAIYEYNSLSHGPQVTGGTRFLQFVSRSQSAKTARDMSIKIAEIFRDTDDGQFNVADRLFVCTLKGYPKKLKVDENGNTYYSFNMAVITNKQ